MAPSPAPHAHAVVPAAVTTSRGASHPCPPRGPASARWPAPKRDAAAASPISSSATPAVPEEVTCGRNVSSAPPAIVAASSTAVGGTTAASSPRGAGTAAPSATGAGDPGHGGHRCRCRCGTDEVTEGERRRDAEQRQRRHEQHRREAEGVDRRHSGRQQHQVGYGDREPVDPDHAPPQRGRGQVADHRAAGHREDAEPDAADDRAGEDPGQVVGDDQRGAGRHQHQSERHGPAMAEGAQRPRHGELRDHGGGEQHAVDQPGPGGARATVDGPQRRDGQQQRVPGEAGDRVDDQRPRPRDGPDRGGSGVGGGAARVGVGVPAQRPAHAQRSLAGVKSSVRSPV